MRKPSLISAALLFVGLLAAAPAARACDQDDDDCSSSDKPVPEYQYETGIAIGMDLLHGAGDAASLASGGDSIWGVRTSMHARLGRRVAIRVGLEELLGTDPAGYKRYELGWNLPDVYFYLTPTSPIQIFTVLGMDMRVEHFESGRSQLSDQVSWGQLYLGAVMGAGIESRLSKATALRLELRGFLRGRAQGAGGEEAKLHDADPAFADATRTQKGVLFSAGLVFF